MFDVIIVGARCAGSPLAMLLGRRGHRVLLVDKARFPSDTVSTHLLWQAGLARAKRWGLLDPIVALGAPAIRTCHLDVGDVAFSGSPPPLDGIDFFIAPRRTRLDKLLLDQAAAAGAEVRESFYVSDLVSENGRVTGIRGRASGGSTVVENARIVVGADGTHSLVAHLVKAARYNERPSTAPIFYAYWRGGPPVATFDTYVMPGVGAAAIPTNDGLTCVVGAMVDAPTDLEEAYGRLMQAIPFLAGFRRDGEQVEPVRGMHEVPGFFRQSSGDGWALAGDAGYHKHPLSAQGITDAFRDADMLSEAIDAGLTGRRDLSQALLDYQRQRDAAVMPMYESTTERARLEPFPPHVLALFRALQANPLEAGRFFGTDAGSVPIPEFFAPANLERIIRSAASASAPGAF